MADNLFGRFCWGHAAFGEAMNMAKRKLLDNPFVVDRRARPALDTLTEKQRGMLRILTLRLLTRPPDQWPARFVAKLDTASPTYVLRLSPNLRVIFDHSESKKIRILDIVTRDTLEEFAEPKPRARPASRLSAFAAPVPAPAAVQARPTHSPPAPPGSGAMSWPRST